MRAKFLAEKREQKIRQPTLKRSLAEDMNLDDVAQSIILNISMKMLFTK